MTKHHYRVGRAREPLPEDKYYSDQIEAIERAARMAAAEGPREPIAVWDDQGGILHLFMCGEQFRPV